MKEKLLHIAEVKLRPFDKMPEVCLCESRCVQVIIMGFVSLPILLFMVGISYYYRYSGISLFYWSQIDVFSFFFYNGTHSWSHTLTENYALWLGLYVLAFLLLYGPKRHFFNPFKFNPNYPTTNLIVVEFLRSLRGIFICSIYEILVGFLVSRGYIKSHISALEPTNMRDISPLTILIGALVLYSWSDAHFYWTHRLLHSPWLYRSVHKFHHESFNPDPFSGLSMHWAESAIYFSSALLLALFGCPLWMVRLTFKSLIIFPLEAHCGFGSWSIESSNNHYIHHSKFNWNYGTSPIWDHLMGTNYIHNNHATPSTSRDEREKEAIEQARIVGCTLSHDEVRDDKGLKKVK
jgi:sterol desaturase/sphingolipid hydroxylase (fatty acid hydroxylase superfamily)